MTRNVVKNSKKHNVRRLKPKERSTKNVMGFPRGGKRDRRMARK